MLKISKLLFLTWNDNSILYCHWKSNEHLNPGLDGLTDLDVLLSKEHQESGCQILKDLGFLKCKSQSGSVYPGVEDWLGFDVDTGKMIHVHLHFNIVTGHTGMKEYILPWSQLALSTRIMYEEYGVYIMDPNLEIITLYTRLALKFSFKDYIKYWIGKYKVSSDYLREIEWLKERISFSQVERYVSMFFGNYSSDFISIVNKKELTNKDVFSLKRISSNIFNNSRHISSLIRFREIKNYIQINWINKWKKKHSLTYITKKTPADNKGLTIAFLGQDGAGKTTVTTDIRKWLGWKLDVRYSYLGSGDNYSSCWKKLYHIVPNIFPLKKLKNYLGVKMYECLSKDLIKVINYGKMYSTDGGMQIFDRFPQVDYAGINDGPKIRYSFSDSFSNSFIEKHADKEERNLAVAFSRYPDIVFKLLLPPEESIRRKPENSLEAIQRKHDIIKNLDFPNSKVYIIDAMQPYEKEVCEIKNIIWQNIQK